MSKQKPEWFENENFWLNYAPIMFDEQHWAEAKGIAEQCVKITSAKPNSRILDACCGLGRIAVELALCGLKVTGVDLMKQFLLTAKETALAEGVQLELLQEDMRFFSRPDYFDVAINCYNSFGYCESKADDNKILLQIFESLKPNGIFLLECISRETAIRYFTDGEWFTRAGKTVLTQFSVEGAWEGLRSKWILIDNKDNSRIEHCFVQRLYSAAELRDTLKNIGFSNVNVFGGWDLRPYDYNAKTMLLVAKK